GDVTLVVTRASPARPADRDRPGQPPHGEWPLVAAVVGARGSETGPVERCNQLPPPNIPEHVRHRPTPTTWSPVPYRRRPVARVGGAVRWGRPDHLGAWTGRLVLGVSC